MTTALVVCGGATVPARTRTKYQRIAELQLFGDDATGNFEVESITASIVRDLDPIYRDLLEIAAYAYLADTQIARWSERDLLNAKWVRQFHFVVPVQEPERWKQAGLRRALETALAEASGDRYRFTFRKRKEQEEQLFSELRHDPFPRADAVCLFSGGADSLAGVLNATEERKLTPLLVSHRSSSVLDSRQENLRERLNEIRAARGPLHHVSVWLNRRGSRAAENSQRTRGFLFLTLASVLAKELRIPLVLVPENGPVSLNLRKLQQSYSSTLSRTTHPSVLRAYEHLLLAIGGPEVRLENPFVRLTKAEVLRELSKYGAQELLEESVSCAHTQGMTKQKPHCGTCSQCIDRRIASVAAGLEEYDPVDRYECDIFKSAPKDGEPRMQVESHVRFIERILASESDEQLANEFSELVPIATKLPGSASANGTLLVAMLQRYASDFAVAFKKQFDDNYLALLAGKLPTTCILRLSGADKLAANGAEPAGGIAALVRDSTVVNVEVIHGGKHVGDHYNVQGQIGAVGHGSHAHDIVFQQRWEQASHAVNLPALAIELERLRMAMKAAAASPEDDRAVGQIAEAEVAATKGDGPTVLARLAGAGKWAAGIAERIGVALVVEAIKRGVHPQP